MSERAEIHGKREYVLGRLEAFANGACSHCLGSKVSKNGYDECPWCEGFGTASMEAKVLDATGRTPPSPPTQETDPE